MNDGTFRNGVPIELTASNVKEGHFRLHSVSHLIPAGAIGGKNKSEIGKPFTVKFDGETFETDVAGDKMILRHRFGTAFKRLDLKEDDVIRVARSGDREWTLTVERSSAR